MYKVEGNKDDFELVDPTDPPWGAGPWEEVFAWKPVYINGERFWFKKVLRRVEQVEVESKEGHKLIQVWRYGTILDVLLAKSQNKPMAQYRAM